MENKIFTEKRVNYDKLHSKLQIFCVKSVKIYTGAARGARDKYEVCFMSLFEFFNLTKIVMGATTNY